MDPPLPREAQASVLEWYAGQARDLAFRGTSDPYAILVSELMAQQTQAARAAAAWEGFLATFPSFAALAAATPAAVLRAWRGLGYNRRALALRRIAIVVMERHGGRLPEEVDALERLPGIGPYTARAVAALAFGQTVGPVDTNVRRVLSRAVLGLDPNPLGLGPLNGARERSDIRESAGAGRVSPATLQRLADAAVPAGRAGAWTHALMDIGAALCRPRAPSCDPCPLQPWCEFARARGPAAAFLTSAPTAPPLRYQTRFETRRAAERAAPFTATTRWLRGRIVERLCDAPDGEWVDLGEQIGDHGPAAVVAALEGLGGDGLAELHPSLARTARLPLG